MNKTFWFLFVGHILALVTSQKCAIGKDMDLVELRSDLEIVWPLAQTVKIEYDLVNAQLEMLETEKEKKDFLEEYEDFVKRKYFDDVKELKIRQGKLLLLLIHRQLGKTPFDLMVEYRNLWRAKFWQRCARMVGADLKAEYSASEYPEIEEIISILCKQPFYTFPHPNASLENR